MTKYSPHCLQCVYPLLCPSDHVGSQADHFPCVQHLQDCCPVESWCFPSGHSLQTFRPPTSANFPVGQFWHVVSLVAPVAVEYVPAAQFWHVVSLVAPVAVENLPASQFRQPF